MRESNSIRSLCKAVLLALLAHDNFVSARSWDIDCFDLGELKGVNRAGVLDTQVQTDLTLLKSSISKLEIDSKVRSLNVCYENKSVDPTKFTI